MAIRRALSSDPNTPPADDALGLYDSDRWQHCLENYWQHFHPLFPIIHRPTLVTTSTPLLTCAMVAIGSQYDSREDAVEYSLALLEAIMKLLSKRDTITSRSRLSDLQTVLLVEVLNKYRSRRANVQISPRFRTCYAGLTQSRQWLKFQPLSLFRSLRGDRSPDKITEAQRFWADCEMKRRILQASFILDTQQAALFEQQPAQGYVAHFQSKIAPPLKTHDIKNEMPFPCSSDLWDSSPVEEWADKASAFEDTSLANASYQATRNAIVRFDSFQTTLMSSYVMTGSNAREVGATTTSELGRVLQRQSTPHAQFSFHAMLMARHAPIRQLLMVSGETWLLGKKVDTEAEYLAAKRGLRSWVDNQDQWAPALWHATKSLELVFDIHHTSYEGAIHDRRLNMLHEEWSIYLAALVCWAVGFDASQNRPSPGVYSTATSTRSHSVSHASSSSGLSVATAHPPLLDPAEADEEMKEYLIAVNVGKPAQLTAVNQDILGRTDGLLEVVRTRRLGGPMGELLNEAERVLYRLVEAKSRISF